MTFTPLFDFSDGVSHYCAGLVYTVRDESLAARVQRWSQEGKVKITAGVVSEVSGVGRVD